MNEVLADHNDRLSQWRRERSQALQQEGHQALRDLKAERRSLEMLEAAAQESAKLKGDVIEVKHRGEQLAKTVHHGIEAMAKRSEAAAQARDRFRELERRRVEEIQSEERAQAEHADFAAKRLQEVDNFLSLFKDHLGLQLARVAPQTVRFALTLVDEEHPDREFAFVLAAPDGGDYEVRECSPALPPRRLVGLVKRLNDGLPDASSALPAFLCCMRIAFQELSR